MKIIVTGATGMVGKGVLLECLDDPMVTEVLSVSRRSAGIQHPKLKGAAARQFPGLCTGISTACRL